MMHCQGKQERPARAQLVQCHAARESSALNRLGGASESHLAASRATLVMKGTGIARLKRQLVVERRWNEEAVSLARGERLDEGLEQ